MAFEDDLGWEYFDNDPMTSPRMKEHDDWHKAPENRNRTGSYGERFLMFHNQFIKKFDDFRHAKGLLPVSAWDPATQIPSDLVHERIMTAVRASDFPYSVNPACKTPPWATRTGGSDPAPIYGYTELSQFQSLDELGRAIDSGWHATVHNTIGGDMSTFHSPIDPIFWRWHRCIDDIRATWEATRHIRLGRELVEIARILFGVTNDGGGAVVSGETIQPVPPWNPMGSPLRDLSPDVREMVLGHMLKKMSGLNLRQESEPRTTIRGNGPFFSVAFQPPKGQILALGKDNPVYLRLWDAVTAQPIASLNSHSNAVRSVAFSPDGTLLASGDWGEKVLLWDVTTHANIATLEQRSGIINSVAFSPDGRLLASSTAVFKIHLWDVAKRQYVGSLDADGMFVYSVAFNPKDGNILASGTNFSIMLWDAAGRRNIATLTDDTLFGNVYSVAFSPDGKLVASGSGETRGTVSRIRIWDVGSLQKIATIEAHSGSDCEIYSIAFSPDGKTIASASRNGEVKLWDVASRNHIITFVHGSELYSVAFSPDGKTLASGGGSGQTGEVMLWDLPASIPGSP